MILRVADSIDVGVPCPPIVKNAWDINLISYRMDKITFGV